MRSLTPAGAVRPIENKAPLSMKVAGFQYRADITYLLPPCCTSIGGPVCQQLEPCQTVSLQLGFSEVAIFQFPLSSIAPPQSVRADFSSLEL